MTTLDTPSDDGSVDEDEMTYDELQSAMLAGQETSINPGPPPSLVPTPIVGVQLRVTGGGGGSAELPHGIKAAAPVPVPAG